VLTPDRRIGQRGDATRAPHRAHVHIGSGCCMWSGPTRLCIWFKALNPGGVGGKAPDEKRYLRAFSEVKKGRDGSGCLAAIGFAVPNPRQEPLPSRYHTVVLPKEPIRP
jgi:hypothetical protein